MRRRLIQALANSFLRPPRKALVVTFCLFATVAVAQFPANALATWSASSLVNPPGINSTQLLGVSCTSLSACTAVGKDSEGSTGGALGESWDGSSWIVETGVHRNPGPKNGALLGVTCTASKTCMSVGTYGTSGGQGASMAQAQKESLWTLYAIPIPAETSINELNDVACRTASWCISVGNLTNNGFGFVEAIAKKFSGGVWTEMIGLNSINSSLRGISCLSETYCLAVGTSEAAADWYRWNGTKWAGGFVPVPPEHKNSTLNDISCISETSCLAVGTYLSNSGKSLPIADKWNGSSWSLTENPPLGSNTEAWGNGVSCVSSTECWAVGEGKKGSAFAPWGAKWTGTKWETTSIPLAPTSEGAQLRDVDCVSSLHCRAVGWSLFSGTRIALVETLTP
jgi:hypothetical protein